MNIKEELLKKLIETKNEYISGSELARQFGVSRNAVWKAVKALEADGFVIGSVTAKGYRLVESDVLLPQLITSAVTAERLGKKAVVFREVDSTNNYAKKLASLGEPDGTVVVAETQTGGKGRLGRSFESPKGSGLYMSLIIRPEFDISFAPLITSLAAVAAAEAVEKLCGKAVDVKWVNDLYMNGRKICGILTEASLSMEMNALEYAVIGIGINTGSHDFGDELRDRVTTVEDETGIKPDRCTLCAMIIDRIEYRLKNIESRMHLDEYRRREILTGNMITANVGAEKITGRAVEIDDNANLIIRLDNGELYKLTSGEAFRVRSSELGVRS